MSILSKLDFYVNIAGGWEIARRYFVMNGFDGVLTVFGIVLGAFLVGYQAPKEIIVPGIGASFAIGISGFWIAFLTEQAEQELEKKKLESSIFTDLDDTLVAKAARIVSFINSFVDGLSPFLFGFLVLSPFFFVQFGFIEIQIGYMTSFILTFILLFVLGLFLGRIGGQNWLIFGLKTSMAGIFLGLLMVITGIE
ncbi:MAG: VIT1/CCC1 transporter family protein [Candidatus Hodarchaeales archaeon]|jgi:predicted membrane protein (TIGR00267 family)